MASCPESSNCPKLKVLCSDVVAVEEAATCLEEADMGEHLNPMDRPMASAKATAESVSVLISQPQSGPLFLVMLAAAEVAGSVTVHPPVQASVLASAPGPFGEPLTAGLFEAPRPCCLVASLPSPAPSPS